MSFCSEYVGVVVRKLAVKYNFDADEALEGLELPTLKRGEAAPKRKEAVEKPKKEKRSVPAIPLPFCGIVNDIWCHAIVKNSKLFTQCTNARQEQDDYCKKCSKAELPFGDIETRTKCGLMEFKDPKGTAVVPYSVVMKKLNINRETAEAEAAKFGWTIDEQQFLAPEEKPRGRPKKTTSDDEEASLDGDKKTGKRGRPKKEKPLKASSQVGDDIIAGLLAQAKKDGTDAEGEDEQQDESSQGSETAAPVAPAPEAKAPVATVAPKHKKTAKSDEDKAAAKAAAKAAKEAEKEAAKAAKEAEKEAAKAAKEAEKAAKEAEKEAAKAAKEAKKTKATIAKAEATTKVKKPVAATAVPAPPAAVAGVEETKGEDKELEQESASEEEESSEEEAPITVKKFEHQGKKYKLSSDNILYDWDNDEPVGVWNPKTKTIDELPSDEEEDEEDDE